MLTYSLLKSLHVTFVLLSLGGFVVRGIWMLRASPMLARRWVRITPHVVDTLLLVTGIALAITLHISPGGQPWLMAKLIGLVAYIVLGAIALRRGRTRPVRAAAFAAALVVFAYIVAVALTKTPLP